MNILHANNGDSAAFLESVATTAPGYDDRFAYIDSTNINAAIGARQPYPSPSFRSSVMKKPATPTATTATRS